MGCCGDTDSNVRSSDPCSVSATTQKQSNLAQFPSLERFGHMVQNSLDYVLEQEPLGKKVVGIMCEYTPREIILAAGGLPVCLCGGSADTIAAAEEELPANLCPLIKSTYGFSVMNANPFLDHMELVVAETTCDGKKKMYELMSRKHEMHILEFPQKEGDPDALIHWIAELRKLMVVLEEKFNVKITDEALWESIRLMNRERKLRRTLAQFSALPNPPISGADLLDLKSLISGIPADLEAYEQGIKELEAAQETNLFQDKTRVLLTGVPLPHGAERVMNIIESQGGIVVAQENCTGLKPIWHDVDETASDPIEAIAKKYFSMPCSVLTTNLGRQNLIAELTEVFKPDVIIDLSWMACLTYDIEAFQIKEFVENELGLPYLRISTDYSPNDSARIALRVQALFETTSNAIDL